MDRVFYNLEESSFFLNINEFVFYFSSNFYMEKFRNNYKEYLKNESLKLNIRYKMIVWADEMLLLSFYRKIEKRGFKVIYKGVNLDKDYYIDCVLNKEFNKIEG